MPVDEPSENNYYMDNGIPNVGFWKYPKMAFSEISQIFLFSIGCIPKNSADWKYPKYWKRKYPKSLTKLEISQTFNWKYHKQFCQIRKYPKKYSTLEVSQMLKREISQIFLLEISQNEKSLKIWILHTNIKKCCKVYP